MSYLCEGKRRGECGQAVLPFYRLDASDKNNGHLVTGYLVSLNGRLVARATGAVSCQVELKKLEANKDYVLTVRWVGHGPQSVYAVELKLDQEPLLSTDVWLASIGIID